MIPAGHEPKALKLDSYGAIIRYFLPEFVNAFLLYFMIVFIDARLVAGLKSTTAYAMVGVTNQLMLFINKVAEGLCIGTVILCGQYQGRKEYEMVGKVAVAAMWATFFVGATIASFLYFNAAWMYRNVLCLPEEMIAIGVPFIRLRAVSILLMFVYLSLIGFYRGVRNTKATMYFYLMGATAFLFSDYALIHGNFGFPAMGFNGSAIASIIEYSTMLTAAILYIVLRKEYRQYNFNFRVFKPQLLKNLFSLSWPVMFDKAALQLEKVWVVSLIAPMGAVALGGLNVVKDMEGLVFLAAAAMGQIVTILVSNEFGAGNYAAIKQSIKRGLIIAFSIMLVVLVALALKPLWFIQMFDKQNAFTSFATKAFPLVGILTFFDLLQLVLAAALRGTSNVKVVMWTRVFSALVLFIPISYAISRIPFESNLMRFVAIYGSFNLVNCFSSAVYYYWFHAGFWLRSKEKSV